jgi:ESS family glutamate:Na+ symporter
MILPIILDFALAGALLLIGYCLRSWVGLLKQFLLPASIVGGIVALVAGPSGFGLVPFSADFSTYPGLLVALIYSALPFASATISWRDLSQQASDLWGLSVFAIVMQWAVGLLLTIYILQWIWPDLHSGFSTILAAGFVGGHGTAAAIGSAFAELDWQDAQSLAMTSATVGILSSICGGIIWVNLHPRNDVEIGSEPQEKLTALESNEDISEPDQTASANSSIIDPFAFQLSIMLIAFLGGYHLHQLWNANVPDFKLPLFCLSFICALFIKRLLAIFGLLSLVDQRISSHIAGTLTDFLIIFGIAAIQFSIIREYAMPLAILFLVGLTLSVIICKLLGPVFIRKHWFEHALFTWGWITGIMAMGIALLRIVDSNNKTRALDHFAFAYLFVVPIEVIMVTLAPQLITRNMEWELLLVTLFIGIILLTYFCWRFIHNKPLT